MFIYKKSLIIALVVVCFSLTFSTGEVVANPTVPVDSIKLQKSTDDINEYFDQKKRDRERWVLISKIMSYVIIPLAIFLFTWLVIKAKQTKKQKLYRLFAWYPLFSFALVYSTNFKLFFLPFIFLPFAIALWFQKQIPKREVVISSIIYFLLLALIFGMIMVLGALASQGAGH